MMNNNICLNIIINMDEVNVIKIINKNRFVNQQIRQKRFTLTVAI